jgi:hypothetical protein
MKWSKISIVLIAILSVMFIASLIDFSGDNDFTALMYGILAIIWVVLIIQDERKEK